jgi:peptidyl-prolyl cis-trans isomerase C
MRRYSRKKNSTKIFIAATLVAALIYGISNYLIYNSNEQVVAKVNGQKIFKSEIEQKLRDVFDGQNQDTNIPDVASLPKEVIEILAKEIYLDAELTKEAKKSKISKTQEVKDQIAAEQNKILRQTYINSLIKSEITDQKVSDKYVELSNDLAGKKEFLISHIVTKTKDVAEKLLRELKSSRSANKFAELAKKHSIDPESAENGGDLGYILEDNMIKEIAEAAAHLEKDEISNPIQTKFGWHLIKVLEIRDAKPLPFESVKDNIRDQLIQDKLNEINSKITKDAKVQIVIELKEPSVKPAKETSEIKENSVAAPINEALEDASKEKEEPKDATQSNESDAKKTELKDNR